MENYESVFGLYLLCIIFFIRQNPKKLCSNTTAAFHIRFFPRLEYKEPLVSWCFDKWGMLITNVDFDLSSRTEIERCKKKHQKLFGCYLSREKNKRNGHLSRFDGAYCFCRCVFVVFMRQHNRCLRNKRTILQKRRKKKIEGKSFITESDYWWSWCVMMSTADRRHPLSKAQLTLYLI